MPNLDFARNLATKRRFHAAITEPRSDFKDRSAPNRSTRLTRGLWYRLGTVHDLETKVDMSSRSFQISVWTAHHAQLAIMFFWASVPLLQLGWQGDYEAWIQNPTVVPIAHAIRDPHFSASAVSAFSASITCTTGVYEWYYTIGLRTSAQLVTAASFLAILGGLCLTAGVIHGASRRTFQFPGQRVLSALDSNVSHHFTGLLGVGSIAWAGHLVHVALPASRGQSVTWAQLPVTLPSPEGLRAFANLDWYQYTKNSDGLSHVFGQADAAAGTSILTFIGTRMPSSDSLYLTDVAHHHLALGILCILLGSIVRTIDLSNDVSGLHWSLALSLAALGTASSFAATNIDAFTVYAFLSNDFTALSALYTHHQYIAGFFLLGAFAHGAIYLIRDACHLSSWASTRWGFTFTTMLQGLGTPELEISLSPVFGQWLQVAHGRQAGSPLIVVMSSFTTLSYGFPCDGPGRGGTCQSSSWDHVFLGLFWMYNAVSVVIFHYSWKLQSDALGTIPPRVPSTSRMATLPLVGSPSMAGCVTSSGLRRLTHVPVLGARLLAGTDRVHRLGSPVPWVRTINLSSGFINHPRTLCWCSPLLAGWYRHNLGILLSEDVVAVDPRATMALFNSVMLDRTQRVHEAKHV